MSGNANHPQFEMSEPAREQKSPTYYAFWLKTEKDDLLDFLETLKPIQVVREQTDSNGRILIAVKDEYDADEVWHYVRQELEREADYVELDDIWDNIQWL